MKKSHLMYPAVLVFVAGNATYKSPCRSVGRSVGPSVPLYFFGVFELFEGRIARVYPMVVYAPDQIISGPAQLITAPAQPLATGAVVYTALFGKGYLSIFFLPFLKRQSYKMDTDLPVPPHLIMAYHSLSPPSSSCSSRR